LYYLLQLFQDTRASTLPESNLQTFFGPKIREYKEILLQDVPDMQQIRKLYTTIRERVIQPVTVRRTRKNLERYPKYQQDLAEQGIVFPEIAPPRAKLYELDPKLSKLFARTIIYLTEQIHYFRYQAIRFLNKENQDSAGYTQAELVSRSLAGIMKTLMVKRLESSFHAFKISLNNLKTSTGRMIEMYENNKILIAPDLKVNDLQEKGVSVEDIELLIEEMNLKNPRNNVFEAKDFVSQEVSRDLPERIELISGLKNDFRLLTELVDLWDKVTDDPKLATFTDNLKNEFFRSDLNPTGKLVVFTESTDTAQYLLQKLEGILQVPILCVSSVNRNKIFETILENFDANLDLQKQKFDYNIIITTDVLAEGVNLHRANIIVNYDTPWNATRLMQRIGRVNRIGSEAGTIYNYNFYPSQHGDEEIGLYNKALVKLQGFHSAFGEDAQIFTHEELVEQFKLFQEDLLDDEDLRLGYLKEIRDFKDTNPREFKRIEKMPLKARTARLVLDTNDIKIKGSSVIFLKSPYKMEFYLISSKNNTKSLTFLEAAQYFEAKSSEVSHLLPDFHYIQVQASLEAFERDFFGTNSESIVISDKTDAISGQARKFLREHRNTFTKNKEVKEACKNLILLVEKGVHAPLSNEIRQLNRKLTKREITLIQADNLLLMLAKKYSVVIPKEEQEWQVSNSSDLPYLVIEPDIVLSETFV